MSELKHIGVARRSGRYPWGSGGDPHQRTLSFRGHIQELRRQGMKEVDIAKAEGLTVLQLRARLSLAKAEERSQARTEALRLKEHGYSNTEIGRRMDINESSVRSLLDPILAERASITTTTANMLKESVDQKKYIDVGPGVENTIGVKSRTRLDLALAELEAQGYKIHTVNVPRVGDPGRFTTMKVLGRPDTTWRDLILDTSQIQSLASFSEDLGRTYRSVLGLETVQHVNSDRIHVRYNKEGGRDKDGIIELRRNVKDLDLGSSQYAQVRIGVDGTHFLKGMAIYSDNMPKGADIVFNTKKFPTDNKLEAMKRLEDDIDNPFKSTIKRQKGAINLVNEEGDWETWSKTLSSQILSKQPVTLIRSQLNLSLKQKQEEFDEIMSLTNPVVKKKLLISFADSCDSSSVHLKAAALPRQTSKVILPITDLRDDEVYAPTFRHGEVVVLIRHPHSGPSEIPQLKVNNKSKSAQSIMRNAPDAIGINPKVAQKLSGADFDGDAVIVIPNGKGRIKTADTLKTLDTFDPIESYRKPKDSNIPTMSEKLKQTKMGESSNLITDMTIKGANANELARAIKHSMVVIDAVKHNLDYKQSFIDHGIASLSAKYQNSQRGGAATLISRAGSEIRIDERKPRSAKIGGPIDPETGAKVYTQTGGTYIDKRGRTKKRQLVSTRMAETEDAFALSSGRPVEEVYAVYANSLKALANRSRKETLTIKPIPYNPSAKKTYAREVDNLTAQLNISLKNKPLERQAQVIANGVIRRKKQAAPTKLDADALKKLNNQALTEARTKTGAKKKQIEITDKHWEAIQAGAISTNRLIQILENTDLERVKQLATPRAKILMTPTKLTKARNLLASGATQSEIAEHLGVSISTVTNAFQ